MYSFENDPLQQVYDDLAHGKTKTHFDEVLGQKGMAKEDFNLAVENRKKEIAKPSQPRFFGSVGTLRPR